MTPEFDEAFKYLVDDEGTAYTNDLRDSGGPTRYGVTQHAYSSYLGRFVSAEEIRDLTPEAAMAFYWDRYWTPLSCEKLEDVSIAIALFDTGVLYGIGTTSILAQKALSECGFQLKFDGHVGDMTVAALNSVQQLEFIYSFRGQIMSRIESVIGLYPKNAVYRRGWQNRANRLLTLLINNPLNREVT